MNTTESKETVNHPNWYKGDPTPKYPEGIEVIDIIHSFKLGFSAGNVEKYLLRSGKKDPQKIAEDFMKAEFYMHDIVMNESGIVFTKEQREKIEKLDTVYHQILKEAMNNEHS